MLTQNGIDPTNDVTIEWKSDQVECLAALTTQEDAIAMLPQPFVATAQSKSDRIRVALDLTEEWDKLQSDSTTPSTLVTGVVVARTAFAEEHPVAVSAFLDHYASSVEFVNSNIADAAQLVGSYDIVTAEIAQKAIPACNIVFVEGPEMKRSCPVTSLSSSTRMPSPLVALCLLMTSTTAAEEDEARRNTTSLGGVCIGFYRQIGAMALDQQILLVSPIQVLARLGELALQAEFWKAVGSSMLRITGGFPLGAAAGTVLAAFSASLRLVEELLTPLLLAIKSIPVASFIILSLILFFFRRIMSILNYSFLMVLPVLYSGVLGGIRAMNSQMLEMAHLFQIPTLRRIRYVYLPQVLPYFQAACTSALGLCWKSGIAAEVIGMPTGSIGERLQQAKVYLDTPDLFAWTLVIVLVSLIFEQSFLVLLRQTAHHLERM